jgi:hypothetical protein
MKASEFIKQNYAPNTTVYTNNNYPVFAYYTQMKTIVLENQDQSFYSAFPDNMREKGLLIIYKDLKHPSVEWANSNSHFKLVKELENIRIYEYNPGMQR